MLRDDYYYSVVIHDQYYLDLSCFQLQMGQLQSELRTKDANYRTYQAKLKFQRTELERHGRLIDQFASDKRSLQSDLANLQVN